MAADQALLAAYRSATLAGSPQKDPSADALAEIQQSLADVHERIEAKKEAKAKLDFEKEDAGWIQDSKANRIYHYERGTKNYLYYDLDEMRSFIFREWDRPNGWLQQFPNSYIASYKSDYARIIPVKVNDERFKHLIRKIEIELPIHTVIEAIKNPDRCRRMNE